MSVPSGFQVAGQFKLQWSAIPNADTITMPQPGYAYMIMVQNTPCYIRINGQLLTTGEVPTTEERARIGKTVAIESTAAILDAELGAYSIDVPSLTYITTADTGLLPIALVGLVILGVLFASRRK